MTRRILINGEPVEPHASATFIETEPGVYSVMVNGVSHEARVLGNEITIAGHRFTFEVDDPRQWKRSSGNAAAHGRATITAPIPGKVVRILAAVGDEVQAGQGIVVVEAMKMQNELKAPRDGRVESIDCRENDSVNAGAVLAIIGQ